MSFNCQYNTPILSPTTLELEVALEVEDIEVAGCARLVEVVAAVTTEGVSEARVAVVVVVVEVALL